MTGFSLALKGIFRVSSSGGKPESVIAKAKPNEFPFSPQLLPDGNTLLFGLTLEPAADIWDSSRIMVQSLKSGESKVLIERGSYARYVRTGHLVYALGSTLFAVPFDLDKLQVAGSPVPVMEGLM